MIVLQRAIYCTLFGFLNTIRETTEHLVPSQLTARNTLADIHITAASYVSRMLKFALFISQRLGLPQGLFTGKGKGKVGYISNFIGCDKWHEKYRLVRRVGVRKFDTADQRNVTFPFTEERILLTKIFLTICYTSLMFNMFMVLCTKWAADVYVWSTKQLTEIQWRLILIYI
jgi:hypothetical protein